MAKEIIIRAAFVSDELTRAASAMILAEYGGYFRAAGQGGYTFADGQAEECAAIEWRIGTDSKDSARLEFLARFAAEYCKAGDQESVYMADIDGAVYLAFGNDRIVPLEEA